MKATKNKKAAVRPKPPKAKPVVFNLTAGDLPPLREVTTEYIKAVVEHYHGDRREAARTLGITDRTIFNYLGAKSE